MTSLSSKLGQIRICYLYKIRKRIYENGNTLCYCYKLRSQRYMVIENFIPEKMYHMLNAVAFFTDSFL